MQVARAQIFGHDTRFDEPEDYPESFLMPWDVAPTAKGHSSRVVRFSVLNLVNSFSPKCEYPGCTGIGKCGDCLSDELWLRVAHVSIGQRMIDHW